LVLAAILFKLGQRLNPQLEYNTQALGLGHGVPFSENKAYNWIFWINFDGVF